MTRIHQLIRKYLQIQKKEMQEPEVKTIVVTALAYLLKVATAKDLNSAIADYTDINPLEFRNSLRRAYCIKNLKFWIWACAYNNYSRQEADEASDDFDIRPKDFKLLVMFRASKYWKPLVNLADTKIVRHKDKTKVGKRRYRAFGLKAFERQVQRILIEEDTYVKKYVYKKLKFLVHSGDSDIEDIVYDLQWAGLMGMYRQYPLCDNRLHLTNIFKCSLQNYGCNLIKHHTTQSRKVLTQELDGTFSSKKISIDNSPTNWGDSLGAIQEEVAPSCDVERLFNLSDTRERSLLTLLTGVYDEHFSMFLKKRGFWDSDESFDRMLKTDIQQFIGLAADFIGLSRYEANVYLNRLRSNLV